MTYFEHFGSEHISMLLFIAAATTSGLVLSGKLSDKNAENLVRILSCIVLAGEIIQDVLLIRDGGNFLEFLPLHLCNLGIFVNIAASFSKGKIRAFFSEISIILIMPGAIGALLFPDWNYRPFWSYLPLLCFLTHSLLVFIPLFFLVRNYADISFRHFWYPYLFLLIVSPPIYLLDIKTGTNYMFLLYPTSDSPLSWISRLSGERFYIPALIFFVTLILVIEYTVYWAAGRFRSKR